MASRSADSLLPLLFAENPVTLDQLQQALGQPPPPHHLPLPQASPHLRGYNHNGRFYTTREPDRFDRFGLFVLGAVQFSRDTSLSATVQHFLAKSSDGWTD